ncbi:uncharacterized protein LOC129766695 [Toxorhynchites rutilus septentrionalis]|uniref:uncharacterized protein LOC129766695 n=1 Tax=Toxorhynchites rutilus septentrionalis TaxID=329112 RepID=UPI002478557D|nr:uncharacterized protein LOC129766695 [Toxorhynchites rutilus septentrionalis]
MALTSYNISSINIATITNPTKLNALRNFVNSQSLDIVCLQEVENDQLSLPGYVIFFNKDHMRRGTAIALKQHIQVTNVERSLDSRLIALRVQDTTICNVYAPSGFSQRAVRENFFHETLPYYLRHNTTNTILAGDFNCVLRTCDSSSPNVSPALKAVVQQLQLHDIWEKLCPRDSGFTYACRNAQSRLDRIYVSSGLRDHLRVAHVHVCSYTDHKALTLRLCLPHLGQEHGRGFWSLRPYLMTNENVAEFQYKWQYWTRQRRNYGSWIEWWLLFAKPKIKRFFKWKSRSVFDEFHRKHQHLYGELRRAYDGYYQHPEMSTTITRFKDEMLALQRRFSHTFVRINETHVAGEPISIFQLGERRRKKTIITQLQTEQEATITESRAIEDHMVTYFATLYSEEARDDDENNFICESVVPPTDEVCMSSITTAEIWSAITASAPRKSPGCDGIPRV